MNAPADDSKSKPVARTRDLTGFHQIYFRIVTAVAAILSFIFVFKIVIFNYVMPEMNGKELKERIEKLRPYIKVLFMSGYTGNVIVHRGILEDNVHYLQKPFSINSLAGKAREVLDQTKK